MNFTDTDLPASQRGRKALPIDADVLAAVQASYRLPEGKGKATVINTDESAATKALLRRAADSLGYGIAFHATEKGTKTTLTFRAKDKSKRDPKPTDVYVVDTEEGALWADAESEGARLASVTEARAIGYTYSEDDGWVAPAE